MISNRMHHPLNRLHLPSIGSISDAGAVVFQTYNWTKVLPKFSDQFLLDCENKPEPIGRRRQKKKPWRYRWPDEVRDEVLARLLALNATRHAEEVAAGTAPGMKTGKKTKPQREKTEEDFQLE